MLDSYSTERTAATQENLRHTAICGVLDETSQPSRELYLARLCLLLVGELDQKDRVMALIEQARVPASFMRHSDVQSSVHGNGRRDIKRPN